MVTTITQWLWRALALTFVCLGLIGVIVPGMPTTVFMLLAAWASSKGWPALNRWVLNHPTFGPPVIAWQQYRIMPRRAKWMATLMMTLSAILIVLTVQGIWLQSSLIITMACVLVWLWTRKESITVV